MAEIVGCLAMSHGPQLLTPPDKWPELPTRTKGPFHPKEDLAAELTPENMRAYGDRCNAAIATLKEKLAEWAPDTVVIVGDDQNENIRHDNMPPFTIFIGEEADASLKYRYFGNDEMQSITRYAVNQPLAEQLITGLMDKSFDPSWSRETRYHAGLGHAFGRVLNFLMPDPRPAIVPVMINTYFPPTPSAKRSYALGRAMGELINDTDTAQRVVLIGSGGLSHTVIDEALDQDFMTALETNDSGYMESMPAETLVSGTSEILNWIVVAGGAGKAGKMIDYVPCYRTEQGVGCAMGFAYWEGQAA
jgi:hypothetical protein